MNTVTKWLLGGAIALILLVAIAPFAANAFIEPIIHVPKAEQVDVQWTSEDLTKEEWTYQNWTQEEWEDWYHIPQGSAFEAVIPYEWFIALEQPKFGPLLQEVPLVKESSFMEGFGFLADDKRLDNPDALPVGFAKSENFWNPVTQKKDNVVGFTCAACHTGQINYKGTGIRIEGGSAVTDVNKFKSAVGLSLGLTSLDPWRFDRFAHRVLGDKYSPETKVTLKKDLKALVKDGKEQNDKTKKFYPPEGFSRLDALDRIDNFVFGAQLDYDNYKVANAPVSYPHIWSSPWFDWVQYNGSVMQPMTRNAGEAMGVFARVDLNAETKDGQPNPDLYRSNVNVTNLKAIEELLAGESIFDGLSAPKWPENILGTIDQEKVAKGKVLYEKNCQQCHLPPMDSPAFMDDKYWTTLNKMDDKYLAAVDERSPAYAKKLKEQNPKYLKVTMKNLYDIGTDPTTTTNWYESTINMKTLMDDSAKAKGSDYFDDHGIVRAGQALPFTVTNTANRKYEDLGIPKDDWDEFDGGRPNLARTPLAYKARPLNGVWSTPPFLHNGSVPSLYEMLVPAKQRTKTFYLGSKEFDPKVVGYDPRALDGGTLVDTSEKGNWNTGHSFEGDGTGRGVIGKEFTDDERWALVEYLKTL